MSITFYSCGHTREDRTQLEDTHFTWVCFHCAAQRDEPDRIPIVRDDGTEEWAPKTATLQDLLNVIHTTVNDISLDNQELTTLEQSSNMTLDIPREHLQQQADVLNIIDLGVRALMPDPGQRWRDSRNPEDAPLFMDEIAEDRTPQVDWRAAFVRGIRKAMELNNGEELQPCEQCGYIFMCECDDV